MCRVRTPSQAVGIRSGFRVKQAYPRIYASGCWWRTVNSIPDRRKLTTRAGTMRRTRILLSFSPLLAPLAGLLMAALIWSPVGARTAGLQTLIVGGGPEP